MTRSDSIETLTGPCRSGGRLTGCKECGIVVEIPRFPASSQYHCPRCHALLYRRGQPFGHILVMAVSALILFLPLTFLPILDLNILGQTTSSTLFDALWMVYRDGYPFIAAVALITGILTPVTMLLLLLAILIPLLRGVPPRRVSGRYRLYEAMREWGMAEVYLISIIVSMVKLHGMGTLHIGLGFYLFVLFFLTFYITTVWFNPDDIWMTNALER